MLLSLFYTSHNGRVKKTTENICLNFELTDNPKRKNERTKERSENGKKYNHLEKIERQAIESRTKKITMKRQREKNVWKGETVRAINSSNDDVSTTIYMGENVLVVARKVEKTGFKPTLLSFLSNCFFYALSTYSKLFCNSWQLNKRKVFAPPNYKRI